MGRRPRWSSSLNTLSIPMPVLCSSKSNSSESHKKLKELWERLYRTTRGIYEWRSALGHQCTIELKGVIHCIRPIRGPIPVSTPTPFKFFKSAISCDVGCIPSNHGQPILFRGDLRSNGADGTGPTFEVEYGTLYGCQPNSRARTMYLELLVRQGLTPLSGRRWLGLKYQKC